MRKSILFFTSLLVALSLVLTACAPQPRDNWSRRATASVWLWSGYGR